MNARDQIENPQRAGFVVSIGNAFDGLRLFGPFVFHDDAEVWAEGIQEEWHIVDIQPAD